MFCLLLIQGFPSGLAVENLPAVPEVQLAQVQSLGQEDPLEEEVATYSSILARKIPGSEELLRLQLWGCKELDATEHVHARVRARAHTHTHIVDIILCSHSCYHFLKKLKYS